MKRAIIMIFCAVFALSACACGSAMDGYREIIRDHEMDADQSYGLYARVSNYDELKREILAIISAGEEDGRIRFIGYDGDPYEDFERVCLDVPSSTRAGALSTYHISGAVNKIVSYYEVTATVAYREDGAVSGFTPIISMEDLVSTVREMLSQRAVQRYVYIDGALAKADLNEIMRGIYEGSAQPPDLTLISLAGSEEMGYMANLRIEQGE